MTATATLPEEKRPTDDWPRLARPVDEFYDALGIGPTARHNLKKMGLTPEIIEIPGSYVRLVTKEAEQRFIERLSQHARSNTEALQAQKERRMRRNGKYKAKGGE
jgi:hypothetical protein